MFSFVFRGTAKVEIGNLIKSIRLIKFTTLDCDFR